MLWRSPAQPVVLLLELLLNPTNLIETDDIVHKPLKQREIQSGALAESELHPVLQRIYAARGIHSLDQLDYSLKTLPSYRALKGITEACDLLVTALREQQRIVIVGDFDADGATSTAVAVSALRAMGAKHVDFLVPNRFTYGYGLTPPIVEEAAKQNAQLIITVDNGIANCDGVSAAKQHGIQVLVTDHHLPGEQLPDADAIVNPNQPGDTFPSKALAGVGVIFYVMSALRAHLRELQWFEENNIPEPKMGQFLDFVALGTIADVVPLDHVNRVLVQQGLLRIRTQPLRPGFAALLQVAKRSPAQLVSTDLGFAIGPRLNAAGRLDDMSIGIACLLSKDLDQARGLAQTLDDLNRNRKTIENEMRQQALDTVERWQRENKLGELPSGFCLFDPDWHQGVVGLVAGRLKERFHRPVIAFAKSGTGELKGSARSIEGLHIRDLLAHMDAQYPGLMIKFGGHAMAAGLSLKAENWARFQTVFLEEVTRWIDPKHLTGELWVDGELPLDELSLGFIHDLRMVGPWGQGFPEPLFSGQFRILEQRLVGGSHLKLSLSAAGRVFDAIAFQVNLEQWPNHQAHQIEAAYRLDINAYNGNRRIQLIIEQMAPVQVAAPA